MNGWTPRPAPAVARKENLIALRNYLLENGMKESAAAIDNALEIMPLEAKRLDEKEELLCKFTPLTQEERSRRDAEYTDRMDALRYELREQDKKFGIVARGNFHG